MCSTKRQETFLELKYIRKKLIKLHPHNYNHQRCTSLLLQEASKICHKVREKHCWWIARTLQNPIDSEQSLSRVRNQHTLVSHSSDCMNTWGCLTAHPSHSFWMVDCTCLPNLVVSPVNAKKYCCKLFCFNWKCCFTYLCCIVYTYTCLELNCCITTLLCLCNN